MEIFKTHARVPFHFVDGAGILFFARIFEMAHLVYEEFVVALGVEWSHWFANSNWAIPLRHAEADYHRPLIVNTDCNVELRLLRLSDSTFELQTRFLEKTILFAEVRTVHTFMDIKSRRKTSIPHQIRSKLLPYLGVETAPG